MTMWSLLLFFAALLLMGDVVQQTEELKKAFGYECLWAPQAFTMTFQSFRRRTTTTDYVAAGYALMFRDDRHDVNGPLQPIRVTVAAIFDAINNSLISSFSWVRSLFNDVIIFTIILL